MYSFYHLVVGIRHINLIHTLLLIPKKSEKVMSKKSNKLTEMMKPIEAEDLATTLVTRWVTGKKDLDSIDTSLQYPLNRLKQFLARGTHEVILTLHPRSSDPCIVAQAGGNHLHIIVRYIDDMELIKETADAFRSIGGYCLGRELKGDDNVHETMCFMKKRGHVYLGTNSQYFLDRYNCVSQYDGIFNRDGQCCLPDGIFSDMSLVIDDEAREAELAICGELPFTAPILQKKEKAVKKRKAITISSDEDDDSGDTEIL